MDALVGWDFVRAQLPAGWRELSDELGLVRPQPAGRNAKITDIEQLLRLEFHRVQLGHSLKVSAAEAAAAGLVDLSSVSLHHWERKLPTYLKRLLAMMIQPDPAWERAHWHGFEPVLADGTTVQRPGAKGTTARVVYAMRFTDMSVLHLEVADEHGHETLCGFQAHRGQVWLFDRNFSKVNNIVSIKTQGGDVVGRLHRAALPLFDAHGKRFNVLERVRRLKKPGQMNDWEVWIHSGGKRYRGRVCAVRLPDDKIEEARERLRRDYSRRSKRMTPETLEAAAWVMVFTTVPRSKLRTDQVLSLYRLRWQIELEIKRDKSVDDLDMLPNFLQETIQTWLYLKLILQQIERKIVSSSVNLPPQIPSAPSQSATRSKLRQLTARATKEAWRVRVLLHAALCAALALVQLPDVPRTFDVFLEHLGRTRDRVEPKQTEVFQQSIRGSPG